jgi:hypothetical protein
MAYGQPPGDQQGPSGQNPDPNWQPGQQQYQYPTQPGQPYGQPGQPYGPYPPQQPPYGPPPKSWPRRHKFMTGCLSLVGLIVVIIVIAAVASSSSSSSSPPPVPSTQPAAASPSAASSHEAAPKPTHAAEPTVTYIVTGSPANVTYGPAGSSLSGHSPMKVTEKLGSPVYYSLTVQLQGGGTVTAEILVDGKVISKATATGGYNIANAEISKNPLTGEWTDTNSE